MMAEDEFESLFEEPEELPATAAPAASAAQPPASSDLEGVVEAVERALRRLDSVLAVHDVLCQEGYDYKCLLLPDGTVACVSAYVSEEELRLLVEKVKKFARLAALVYNFYERGMLPNDVKVYTLRRSEPSISANAVVFGLSTAGAVPAYTSPSQHGLYYVFKLSRDDAAAVLLGFDADWRLEATALYTGERVARAIKETLLDVLQHACLSSGSDAEALSRVLRLARKLSQL